MDFDVVIVGGGIQGAGLLHDLASRRLSVHLIEERRLAIGTSSRSTKLVHGGLRYLERLTQWPLVHDALKERALLLRLLSPVVKPLPFVLPTETGTRPRWLVGLGLGLYDVMAGDSGLPRSRSLSIEDVQTLAPYLKVDTKNRRTSQHGGFLFYDAQMIDDAIVRLAARAGVLLGGSYEEGVSVSSVEALKGTSGFKIKAHKTSSGVPVTKEYRARMVLVSTGAWNNANLLRWGIAPQVPCLLNAGSHMIFGPEVVASPPERCAASLVQNDDGRVLFFLPWFGRWLFGTTESAITGDPRNLSVPPHDIEYLRTALHKHFALAKHDPNPEAMFCGVRTMPLRRLAQRRAVTSALQNTPFESDFYPKASSVNISHLSRESVIDEPIPGMLVLYGGKYTTYRSFAEHVGRIVKDRLGMGGQSLTRTPDAWFLEHLLREEPNLFSSVDELRSA